MPGAMHESRRTAADRRHSPSRERVLREIESRGSASISELAAATDLHENTVRGHLTRLHSDGHIRREPETLPAAGRGRPAQRWCPVSPEQIYPYAGLAATLAEALKRSGADDAPRAAREAGAVWGEQLAQARACQGEAQSLAIEIMRQQGFAPEETEQGVYLHRCPLAATASRHSEVVCAAHAGMLDGIVRTRSAAPAHVTLLPFAADGACLLQLRATA